MGAVDMLKSGARVKRWRCSSRHPVELSVQLAQGLLFTANILALAGFLDCRLVMVREDLEAIFSTVTLSGDDLNLTMYSTVNGWDESNQRKFPPRGVGLMGWEGLNGTCFCKDDVAVSAGYLNVTGDAWDDARDQMWATIGLSWPIFLWLLTFSCMTYSRMHRTILGLVLIVVLCSAQSLQWLLFESEFCQEFGCEFGSGLILLIVSSLLTITSGVVLILFNREKPEERMERRLNPLAEDCTLDEEERRRDGFNNAREVPVEQELIDLSLVNPTAAPAMVTTDPRIETPEDASP